MRTGLKGAFFAVGVLLGMQGASHATLYYYLDQPTADSQWGISSTIACTGRVWGSDGENVNNVTITVILTDGSTNLDSFNATSNTIGRWGDSTTEFVPNTEWPCGDLYIEFWSGSTQLTIDSGINAEDSRQIEIVGSGCGP